jgi:hypothetical protein
MADSENEAQKQLTKEEKEALLAEYQLCQREAHYNGSTYWTIVGIYLSFTTAIAAWIIKNVIDSQGSILDSGGRWLIFGLSLLAIFIIFFLLVWLERTNYFIQIANKRTCDIEALLSKNSSAPLALNRINCYLGKCENSWPNELKEMLKQYKKGEDNIKICCLARVLKGRCIAIALFILVSIPWIFLAIISACKCVKVLILG